MPKVEISNHVHPDYPFLKWGQLHTPFMIYVRSYNKLTDEDYMKMFGLQDYQKMSPPLPFAGWHVVFANDSEWTHIADDYGYTLWHSAQTVAAIKELSQKYDVFRCSIGDIDEAFEFVCFQNGKCVRRFEFAPDVSPNKPAFTISAGNRLPGEPKTANELKVAAGDMFSTIVQALGIRRVNDPSLNRFYGKKEESVQEK
jgi:hypothetical protein